MTIEKFISNVQSLDAETILMEAASLNTDELADLNTQQMESGIMSTGENITPKYGSNAYAQYKKSIGSKSSPTPDLKLTGDFHSGLYAKVENKKLKFGSTDWKEGTLQQQYTADIFGVTTDNLISQTDSDIPTIIDKMLMK